MYSAEISPAPLIRIYFALMIIYLLLLRIRALLTSFPFDAGILPYRPRRLIGAYLLIAVMPAAFGHAAAQSYRISIA